MLRSIAIQTETLLPIGTPKVELVHPLRGIEKHSNGFVRRLKRNMQHALAQLSLGDCHADGRATPKNPYEAFRWYMKAALQGVAEAEAKVGVRYVSGIGVNNDNEKAAMWLNDLSPKATPADNTIGSDVSSRKRGLPGDQREARRLWRLAAAQGFQKAVHRLRERPPENGWTSVVTYGR